MRRYELVSGTFFTIVAAVQLIRALFGWPVRVADVDVPLWASGIAFVVTAGMAVWAFRAAARRRPDAPAR